jgi:hypothetical protein
MQTKIIQLDPRKLKPLAVNAHFMEPDEYQRLVANIRKDGTLSSVPFVCIDDPDAGEPVYEVLSGNHRVSAAIDAGLEEIYVLATDEFIDPQRRIAIQLSHNAIKGQDDPTILRRLYEELDIDWKQYAALDDKTLELLEKSKTAALGEANLAFQTFSLVFLPDEVERVKAAFQAARDFIKGSQAMAICRWSDYDRFLETLDTVSAAHDVMSSATALMLLLDLAEPQLATLTDAWYDQQAQQARRTKGEVPASVLVGSRIPVKSATVIQRAVGAMIDRGEVPAEKRYEALVRLAETYLNDCADSGKEHTSDT